MLQQIDCICKLVFCQPTREQSQYNMSRLSLETEQNHLNDISI